MKQLFKKTVIGLLMIPLVAATALVAVPNSTANATCSDDDLTVTSGSECAQGKGTKSNLVSGNDSLLKTVTNVLLFLIGAVSVIMIIVGAIRYVLSNGDSSQITGAKNTILYAVIGLVVALLAFAIVSFITGSFVSASGSGGGTGTPATN